MRAAEWRLLIAAMLALGASGCSGTFALNLNPAQTPDSAARPQAGDAAERSARDAQPPGRHSETFFDADDEPHGTEQRPQSLDALLETMATEPAEQPLSQQQPVDQPPPPIARTAAQADAGARLPALPALANHLGAGFTMPPAPLPEQIALAALPPDAVAASTAAEAVAYPNTGNVAPASHTATPSPPGEQDKTWSDQLSSAIVALERELAGPIEDTAEQARLEAKLRLLHLASDRPEKAFRWIEQLQSNEQDYVVNLLESWHAFFDPQGPPDPRARAAIAQRSLRNAGAYLAAASKLDLRNLTFCQRVDGYGQYEEFERTSGQHQFQPSQEILLYVEVENFTAKETKDGRFETELAGSYYITPLDGSARLDDQPLPLDKQTSRRYRRDYYLPYRIYLPKTIERGQYLLQLQVKDVKGEKFGHGSIEFAIR